MLDAVARSVVYTHVLLDCWGWMETAVCIEDAKPVLPEGTILCFNNNIYGTGLFSDDAEGRFLQSLITVRDQETGTADPLPLDMPD